MTNQEILEKVISGEIDQHDLSFYVKENVKNARNTVPESFLMKGEERDRYCKMMGQVGACIGYLNSQMPYVYASFYDEFLWTVKLFERIPEFFPELEEVHNEIYAEREFDA